jgi:NDP-sugar pyrophosphorylase family protein
VLEFAEKGGKAGPGWINAGIYLLAREVIRVIPSNMAVSLERDVFPSLITAGLLGIPHEGHFLDIGTPESYRAAESFFAA